MYLQSHIIFHRSPHHFFFPLLGLFMRFLWEVHTNGQKSNTKRKCKHTAGNELLDHCTTSIEVNLLASILFEKACSLLCNNLHSWTLLNMLINEGCVHGVYIVKDWEGYKMLDEEQDMADLSLFLVAQRKIRTLSRTCLLRSHCCLLLILSIGVGGYS